MHYIIIEDRATHTFRMKHGRLVPVLGSAPEYARNHLFASIAVDISRAKDICLDIIYYMFNIWLYNISKYG